MKNFKQTFIAIVTITLSITCSFAQRGQSGNCVSQGTFIIDGTYGFPYFLGNIIKNGNSSTITDAKVVNYNHIGGRIEYMVSSTVGLGLDYTFARVTNNFVVIGQPSSVRYNESLTKQRILGRINIHFATSPQLDPYVTAGVGYKTITWESEYDPDVDLSTLNLIPVAFRIGMGLRWYFTDIIGLGVEAGIGGPAFQGGITAKF